MLPLTALRAFDLVARTGTFTDAARALNVTRPAISKQIRHLESLLGIPLIIRTRPRIILTNEGLELAATLVQSFDLISATTQRLIDNANRPETVRVLVDRDFASSWLAERIGGFLIEHPGISVEITAERNGKMRMDENFSFRIFYGPEGRFSSDGIEENFLCDWIDIPLCTAEYAAEHIPGGRFSPTAHFLNDKNYAPWDAWFRRSGIEKPAGSVEQTQFNETTLCLSATLAGSGITIGDSLLCLYAIEDGRLIAPFRLGIRSVERYSICHRRNDTLTRAETVFRNWLRDAIGLYQGRVEQVVSRLGIEVADA